MFEHITSIRSEVTETNHIVHLDVYNQHKISFSIEYVTGSGFERARVTRQK